MRVLFVHEVNYRRKVVYEIHDFPEILALRGHEIAFLDFPEGEERRGFRRLVDLRTEVRTVRARAHEGAEVEVWTPGRVLPPPLDRLAASLTHGPVIARALRQKHPDVVVLYGVPTNGWLTILLAKWFRIPVLFRAIDISHALRPTIYGSLIRRAEHYIFRNAAAVSANNVALRRYAIDAGAAPERVSVEYPGIDLERFHPGPKSAELLARFGLAQEDRIVLFMGTLFRFAGLDWFITEIAPALRSQPRLKVLILGGGEAERELRAIVDRLQLSSQIVFAGFIDYPSLAAHIRLGDVAINPFAEELVTNAALPGKILQYAACGLPTVCTRLEGIAGLLPDGEGTVYAAPGAAFAAEVLRWVEDPEACAAAGRRARRAVEARCQWDACADAFESVVAAVAARSAARP